MIDKHTYASSKPLIASLIPSDPEARVPYGSLVDPETLLSSETFSDSSLRVENQHKIYPIIKKDEPEQREHSRHSPHRHDLVLDDLPALHRFWSRRRDRRRNLLVALFKLLLCARIQYRHKHVRD